MYPLIVLFVVLLLLIVGISRWGWHPFITLLLAGLALGVCSGLGGRETVDLLAEGFGNTLQWIAVVVILGAFVGEVLRETGGALRISTAVVRLFGERFLPWAMGLTGYIVSIPVFVDVAYIVLQPVTEAIAARSRRPVLVIGLALTAGLTVSHTLLPPTPGPLAVASILEADLGRMILINAFVGLCCLAGGVLWATYGCRNVWIAHDDRIEAEQSAEQLVAPPGDRLRGAWFDLLPIVVPILLMAAGSFRPDLGGDWVDEWLIFLSTPMIAVLIGAGVAAWQYRNRRQPGPSLGNLVEQAIVKSALVIMITGAGGAFGYLIRAVGIQDSLAEAFTLLPWIGFFLPFMVSAILTTATGSITVSLIGAASIVGPMQPVLPYSVEVTAALVGCGAFCVFHANSSFFWLLNRLHDVPVPVLYRTYTVQSLVMGMSGLIGVGVLYFLGLA
ncbi:GntP family gluconate:H+ symporter [Lewinella marina]|uniref:Gluconate transporter n=1 Tax=Neolewinella marina TaxID=438751 RepID=A0A2G0CDT0_9BACT|nr:GntP family permease [Neolewinella marina]NJB85952.1 GntP family gluconate:H+ symporter [Neolewinella marina]PHK98077.1 gluconate transporter [Neolewinella marina]